MATFISHSPEETEEFAAGIGERLTPGCVIGLNGELGAGKTQFVKGLARGLGITERVHSPTFALLNLYGGGRLPLFHLDLYRLENDEQIVSAGLEEFFSPSGISVIEWIDRWRGPEPACYRQFFLEILNDSERRISYADTSA